MRMMGVAGFLIPLVSIARRGDAPAGAALALRPPRRRAQADPARASRSTPSTGFGRGSRARSWRGRCCSSPSERPCSLAAALPALALQLTPGSTFGIPRTPQAIQRLRRAPAARSGPGAVAPARCSSTARTAGARPAAQAAIGRLVAAVKRDPEVARRRRRAGRPLRRPEPPLRAGRSSPASHDYGFPEAQAFVHRLRGTLIPAARLPGGVDVLAGGAPAQGVDFLHGAYSVLPAADRGRALLTYLLLMRAFRSLLLPLKAVLLNLLSVAAAYGMLVVVFSWGVGEDAARPLPVRPGRGLDPDLPLRDALRPLDGLRGLPRHAHARGVGRRRRQRDRGRVRARAHGPDHHRGGDHHVRRVLGLRRRPDRRPAAVRPRPRGRDPRRRDARPLAARAEHDGALRPLELVAAGRAARSSGSSRRRSSAQRPTRPRRAVRCRTASALRPSSRASTAPDLGRRRRAAPCDRCWPSA